MSEMIIMLVLIFMAVFALVAEVLTLRHSGRMEYHSRGLEQEWESKHGNRFLSFK